MNTLTEFITFMSSEETQECTASEYLKKLDLHGKGVLSAGKSDEGDIFVGIWPGTIIGLKDSEGNKYSFRNPKKPERYLICPSCGYIWEKRARKPKQCPLCHKRLHNVTLKRLSLANQIREELGVIEESAEEIIVKFASPDLEKKLSEK